MYESYYISQLGERTVATSCTLSFCSVFHQPVTFQTKVFHSFQFPFSSFLLASLGAASSSVPVGDDFPTPPPPCSSFFPLFLVVSTSSLCPCFSSYLISVPTLSFSFPILFFHLSSPQAPLIFSRAVLFLLTYILYLPFSAPLLSDALVLEGYPKLTCSPFFPQIPSF